MLVRRGLDSHVLVLNRAFQPITITGARRAFRLLINGAAHALDENLRAFDFDSWASLSIEYHQEFVRTPRILIRVPKIVLLQFYDRIPTRHVRFSRQNIYMRDNFTCQYCEKHFTREKLNLDHVVPHSQGGHSTWENVVCCCVQCNLKKGARTPKQAGMTLLKKPRKPPWWSTVSGDLIVFLKHGAHHKEWAPFLDPISASYWNAELEK